MTAVATTAPHDNGRPTCGATNRAGTPCLRPAGWGTHHPGYARCKLHGGSSPGGEKQGARLKLADQAATMGVPADVDPAGGLLALYRGSYGAQAWLGMQVSLLRDEEFSGPVGGGKDAYPSVELNIRIRAWNEERDRAARFGKLCVDAKVDERRLRLEEAHGEELAVTMRRVLVAAGVDLTDPVVQERVRAALMVGESSL